MPACNISVIQIPKEKEKSCDAKPGRVPAGNVLTFIRQERFMHRSAPPPLPTSCRPVHVAARQACRSGNRSDSAGVHFLHSDTGSSRIQAILRSTSGELTPPNRPHPLGFGRERSRLRRETTDAVTRNRPIRTRFRSVVPLRSSLVGGQVAGRTPIVVLGLQGSIAFSDPHPQRPTSASCSRSFSAINRFSRVASISPHLSSPPPDPSRVNPQPEALCQPSQTLP